MFHRRLNSQSEPQRDLSNRKLAQNQTELSQQISELRVAVEQQGQVIRELLTILEGQGKGKRRESIVPRNSIS